MAENKLTPFANGDGANVVDETTWQGDSLSTVRSSGFQSGIAKSNQINRVLAQGASAGYAIGELVKEYANEDASINASALYAGFVEALKSLSKRAVIDVVFPVGSVYISTASTNPAELFGIGTWERIGSGRTLIDAGGSFVAGTTGGTDTHQLTVNELPPHSHAASTGTSGGHTHNRGSMNIAGELTVPISSNWADSNPVASGAFSFGGQYKAHFRHYNEGDGGLDWGRHVLFNGSNAWSGETSWSGDHSHGVSVSNTGGGKAFSTRNPYLAVYIWKRTA